METGGYKNRSRSMPKTELHALITERLGVPPSHIICEYGMSELSSQAYDDVTSWRVASCASNSRHSRHPSPVTRHFHFPPWARAQIISPETGREVADGETGLIRVFDLANVFSVMAIQTEDLGIRRGDGFELIGRAQLAEPRGCSLMAVKLVNRKSHIANPMNLPNYFLADLPPEATLSPAMITEACQTLKRNRERYLAARSTDSLVKVLSDVAEGWLQAGQSPSASWR